MAASVISKYGSLNSNYREATGINMSKIDDLITEALAEGDVPIKSMSPTDRAKYLQDLKTEALDFPKLSFGALSEQVHVPYMIQGVFNKIPSRYFGAWDFETASNEVSLEQMGIQAAYTQRLGPYHPMFLVTVGGRGFTQENTWDVGELRQMLRGDIDERPAVMARRTAAWMQKNPGLDPNIYRPFEKRERRVPVSTESLAQKFDPQHYEGLDERELEEVQNERENRIQNQYNQSNTQSVHAHQTMPQGGNAYFDAMNQRLSEIRQRDEGEANKTKKMQLDDIPEIADADDEANFDQQFSQSHSQRLQEELKQQAQGSNDLGKAKPILPKNYPQLNDVAEQIDPNQITFNTGNMTEFHKTHEVNEYDIKETSETLLSTAEFTYKMAKNIEQQALATPDSEDVSHKLRLRYFVDTQYQEEKNERLAKEIDGDYSGVYQKPKEADVVGAADRIKPNPFDKSTPERLQIDLDNPQHELYGGPITVQHFLTGMIDTEEGKQIAKAIEIEHREFLGDDVYDEAIKNSPVNKKPVTKQPSKPLGNADLATKMWDGD